RNAGSEATRCSMPNIGAYDAWVLSRIMADLPVDDAAVAELTTWLQPLAERLAANEAEARPPLLAGFAAAEGVPMQLVQAIVDARPTGPAPDRERAAGGDVATLADVCRLEPDRSWPWPGWLPRGALTALASDPGVGKTLLAMSIARALWHGRP